MNERTRTPTLHQLRLCRLNPRDSVILGRAVKERHRRPDAAAGFSNAGGDCMAFKYLRDAEETRNKEERRQFVGAMSAANASLQTDCAYAYSRQCVLESILDTPHVRAEQGIKVAVTDGGRQRLVQLVEDQESTAPQDERKASTIEVGRLTKEELGSRLVPLAGAYLEASAEVRKLD